MSAFHHQPLSFLVVGWEETFKFPVGVHNGQHNKTNVQVKHSVCRKEITLAHVENCCGLEIHPTPLSNTPPLGGREGEYNLHGRSVLGKVATVDFPFRQVDHQEKKPLLTESTLK